MIQLEYLRKGVANDEVGMCWQVNGFLAFLHIVDRIIRLCGKSIPDDWAGRLGKLDK
jgi:hypothetical protein